MYLPPHFAETRPAILHDLITAHPLGTLVTLGSNGLDASTYARFVMTNA